MAESQGNRTSDNKQTTASGAEVIFLFLLVAFGMGLVVWVERAFSFIYKEPTEQQFLDTAAIKEKQERLARLESAIKEAEKQLDVVELEKLRHTAALQSFEKSQGAASADVQRNYDTAKLQQLAANEYATLLNTRAGSLKKEAEQTAAALKPEKEAAEQELTKQRRRYVLVKTAAAFLFPSVVVLVGLFIGARVFNRVTGRRVWISQGRMPVLLVLGLLLVLLAFQLFEIAGAVLIGMILFLLVLRKINWSPKAGAKGNGLIAMTPATVTSKKGLDEPLTDPANDLLDVDQHARALANYIRAQEKQLPFTVGIFGEWGEGKTTMVGFLKHHLSELRKMDAGQEIKFVTFSAWPFTTSEKLWRALILEIAKVLFNYDAKSAEEKEKLQKQMEQQKPESSGWWDKFSGFLANDFFPRKDPPPPLTEYERFVKELEETDYGRISKRTPATQVNQEAMMTAVVNGALTVLGTVLSEVEFSEGGWFDFHTWIRR